MATMTESVAEQGKPAEKLKVELRKVIGAPRAKVFDAWKSARVLAKWFGPAEMTTPEVEVDFRVGGQYRIAMQRCTPPGGAKEGTTPAEPSVATGEYREIVTNERLSFTWTTNWSPGEETLVTILLKDVTGGTEVTLIHEGFGSAQTADGHEKGWKGSLDKLAAMLEE